MAGPRRKQVMLVVDLGCGENKRAGAVGLDNAPLPGVDIVHDLLDFPYPFAPGIVDQVILSHVFEHFTIEQSHLLLGEIFRILRPGGRMEINVPHAFSVAAWVDPTHRRFFTFDSVKFYTRRSAKAYYQETASVWDLAR
ncbi:MAG TPA: methyltransferase domain-containing protein, partial [Chloroflexia bacterium]|nr:methyltransferase domain-containing protein [Chloroflexia bacterium]